MVDTIRRTPVKPFDDQRPGTSGLRKRVSRFLEPHYLECFVQSLFDAVGPVEGVTLVVGGDGRFHNDAAIQTILKMASANGVGRVIVGAGGLLSTPAASHLIRKNGAFGGIILSASHNPGGPDGDFGIKFNTANGGPAPEKVTEAIFARSRSIEAYRIAAVDDVDIDQPGQRIVANMGVEVVDPVADYADLMETLFDFDALRDAVAGGLRLRFDAMHAITGPYAREIFERRLGFAGGSVINAVPDPAFGGGHPDPNLVHAADLLAEAMSPDGPDLCAASDGDGDRNLIIGRAQYVSPSDSLAVIAANAHLAPQFSAGLSGVARSMPTSGAVDRVAQALGIPCFETPTGWKFFGNLLDAGRISLCGEESAGTGADHVREKDGVWAVLMWLSIIAARGESVAQIMAHHWARFGRTYHVRHDYEEVDADKAGEVVDRLTERLPDLGGRETPAGRIAEADSFSYTDPLDGSVTANQGLRVMFEDGSRFVMRLSGTGTLGATLRLYLERYERPDGRLDLEPDEALASLIEAAETITSIRALTGRAGPDVIA